MEHSSHAIANAFISIAEKENKKLTNMQIQKLVFIAHGYCLALLGEPLFYHNAHAWQWGPVIPKLYKSLQKYGNYHVDASVDAQDSLLEEDVKFNLVEAIYKNYSHYSGSELSALTHQENTPWSITWSKDRFGIIPNNIISAHYKKLLDDN